MIKPIRITGLILFLLTLLWVVLMGLSTIAIEPGWGPVDYVKWVSEPSLSYRLNYINVSVLTLGVVLFFTLLYSYLKQRSEGAALAGLIFVPIYGVMNLICYSLQISLVPFLAQAAMGHPESMHGVSQWIQANPASAAGFINGLAYAVLGIPSIIFGYLLMAESGKFSGLTLMLNGIFCVIGIIGMMLDIRILSMGVMVGGFLFLVSLGCIWFELRSRMPRSSTSGLTSTNKIEN
ncbi:MAG: hypothetical protein ABFS28_02470 [Bacteroidota bacterium]